MILATNYTNYHERFFCFFPQTIRANSCKLVQFVARKKPKNTRKLV